MSNIWLDAGESPATPTWLAPGDTSDPSAFERARVKSVELVERDARVSSRWIAESAM